MNSNSGNVGITKVNINSLHVVKGKNKQKKVTERRRGISNRQPHIDNVNIFKSNSDNVNEINNMKERFIQVSSRMKKMMNKLFMFVEKK